MNSVTSVTCDSAEIKTMSTLIMLQIQIAAKAEFAFSPKNDIEFTQKNKQTALIIIRTESITRTDSENAADSSLTASHSRSKR